MSWAPRSIQRLEAERPLVQWAAVRMWVEEMRVAPHRNQPFLTSATCEEHEQEQEKVQKQEQKPTCQGYSLASAAWPPTILLLVAPPLTPH